MNFRGAFFEKPLSLHWDEVTLPQCLTGKSTLACTVGRDLHSRGKLSYILDGDNLRHGLNKDLGFKAEDRAENIRRVGKCHPLAWKFSACSTGEKAQFMILWYILNIYGWLVGHLFRGTSNKYWTEKVVFLFYFLRL